MPVDIRRQLVQTARSMVSALKKAIIFVLLCAALFSASSADAREKYYRYSGNMPFIEMMLDMMAAMGMIQRVPANGLYGGYNGGRYGALSSLWSHQGLPYGAYSPYSGLATYPYTGYGGWPGTTGWRGTNSWWGSGAPLTISPLAGYPGGLNGSSGWYGPYSASPYDRNFYRVRDHDGYGYYDDDCRYGNCDGRYYRHLNLDGLWVTSNGEMLGLRDGRFLWSDGDTGYATGVIERTPRTMRAYIDNSNQQIVYRYKLRGNEMLTMDGTGTLRVFRHVPVNQASAYIKHRSGQTGDAAGPEIDPWFNASNQGEAGSGRYDEHQFDQDRLDGGRFNGGSFNEGGFYDDPYGDGQYDYSQNDFGQNDYGTYGLGMYDYGAYGDGQYGDGQYGAAQSGAAQSGDSQSDNGQLDDGRYFDVQISKGLKYTKPDDSPAGGPIERKNNWLLN